MENILLEYTKGAENFRKGISSVSFSKAINQIMVSSGCSEYDAIKFSVETLVSTIKGVTSYTFSWEDDDNYIHSMSKEL